MTTRRQVQPVARGALRCSDYFVHVPTAMKAAELDLPLGDDVWIALRPAHTGTLVTMKALAKKRPEAEPHILGPYKRIDNAKQQILEFFFQRELSGEELGYWHVHHVVEGDFYADVHFEDVAYQEMYDHVLPCVIASGPEHGTYFHGGASRGKQSMIMYGVKGAGKAEERANAAWKAYHAARKSGDRPALAELRDRVAKREQLYADLYHYDDTLAAIAAAVFRRVRARLDEAAR